MESEELAAESMDEEDEEAEADEAERGTVTVATGMLSSEGRSFLTTLPSPSRATLLLPP